MSRMMRNALYVLLASVFLLTACGGGSDDDTPAPDSATPEAQNVQPDQEVFSGDFEEVEPQVGATYYNELGTVVPQELVTPVIAQPPGNDGLNGFVAPPVGVLGAASTADPSIQRVSGFDYLFYEQTGGINDETLRIEVFSDGRVSLNNGDNEFTVASGEINDIAAQMDRIDFFGMQGTFLGPPSAETDYTYRMGASQSDGTSRLIQARDGYMPPEIIRLFALIRGLVEEVPNLATPVPTPTAE